MPTREVEQIVKKYIEELNLSGFLLSSVYLFGSRVNGKFHDYSDIDVAVISPKMKYNYEKNLDLLNSISLKVDDRLEVHAFTPRDFRLAYSPLIYEIKKTGIKVY